VVRAGKVKIAKEVRISEDADIIVSDELAIGPYTIIEKGFKARCRNLHIGKHVYIQKNCEIGFGGWHGLNSNVFIDDYVGIFDGTTINCADEVFIGKYCGLGQECKIWTHGAWLPVVDGFPSQHQAPVYIGNKVWIPARTQILAGVTIGDNVVIGINSLVNKDLPPGCFAAGLPAKVIRENVYPRPLSDEELHSLVSNLCEAYIPLAEDKGFTPDIQVDNVGNITFSYDGDVIKFDTRNTVYSPIDINIYTEDFRDYLRRNGFKFYQGGFFKSLSPRRFLNLDEHVSTITTSR